MLKRLKTRNRELEERINKMEHGNKADEDDNDDKDKVLQLMIENKVLDCEKKKAENEVEVWKSKCSQLQLRVIELEKALASKCHHCVSGTPLANTPFKHFFRDDGGKCGMSVEAALEDRSRARKCLTFAKEGSPSKKIAPSTPAGVRPAILGVIDIDDSDNDDDKKTTQLHSATPIVQGCSINCHSTDFGLDGALEENKLPPNSNSRTLGGLSNEDDGVGYEGNISFISTSRKRRSCNVVTSDAESDDNDDVPISRLRNNRSKEQKTDFHLDRYHRTNADSRDEVSESGNGHRLRRLRKCEEKSVYMKRSAGNVSGSGRKYQLGIPTDQTVENDEEEEEGYSDRDGHSLEEFIVSDSEVSESDTASDGDGATESEDTPPPSDFSGDSENVLDDKVDYKDIISRIRRNRDRKVKWEFEADMLAAFGKDPELCMRAVCALYRQQTSAERIVKGTLVHNGRGFSQCDALRGSKLAEFLLDGDPQSDLKKSVEELHKHDPKGLEVCRQLASRYSKQLFEIYKSKEDPFFLPS